MGYFTIYNESDYDVHMDDIIDNLKSFNDKELMELMENLETLMNKDTPKKESFEIKNLDDYHKIGILKEMFDKYSWSELEKIKKSL